MRDITMTTLLTMTTRTVGNGRCSGNEVSLEKVEIEFHRQLQIIFDFN